MIIFIGLGNNLPTYFQTKHNLGRQAVEYLAKQQDFPDFKLNKKLNLSLSTKTISDHKIMLGYPETLMNNCGPTIEKLRNFYKLTPDQIVLIYDDFDIPLGTIRYRQTGSSGGHKGVESIPQNKNYPRLKIGAASPQRKAALEEVLTKFNQTELTKLTLVWPQLTQLWLEIINNPSLTNTSKSCLS